MSPSNWHLFSELTQKTLKMFTQKSTWSQIIFNIWSVRIWSKKLKKETCWALWDLKKPTNSILNFLKMASLLMRWRLIFSWSMLLMDKVKTKGWVLWTRIIFQSVIDKQYKGQTWLRNTWIKIEDKIRDFFLVTFSSCCTWVRFWIYTQF